MKTKTGNNLETCRNKLKAIVGKKELYFTKRCNKSIDISVIAALNKLDRQKERLLIIQEEGGWITYKNQAKKHNLTLVRIRMDKGRLSRDHLIDEIEKNKGNSILIMHSLPGYSYEEDMGSVFNAIKSLRKKGKSAILINDCCGSIGSESGKVGDIVVCSFGEAKPLSAGGGGFIAADNFSYYDDSDKFLSNILQNAESEAENTIDFDLLINRIDELKERRKAWYEKAESVKYDLRKRGFNILNPEKGGINVLVEFSGDNEKERLINYCKEKGMEYTECPRYIRTNKQAISIEIKRLKSI